MSNLVSMKTMANVVHWIDTEASFTPAFRKKVLGSVRKMQRLPQYRVPLEQIPADLEGFDVAWQRGPVRNLPSGFNSKSSFIDWRSQVRSALTGFSGAPMPTETAAPDDDWTRVAFELESVGVQKRKLISVKVLADAARRSDMSPDAISQAWLQSTVDAADTTGRYRSIQAASKLIFKNAASLTVPISPDLGFPVQKSRSHCCRLALPETLATEVENWMKERIKGERKGHRQKRKSACSPNRAKEAVSGVSYVYTAMVTAGLIEANYNCSVSDLSGPDLLEEVIERELNAEFPWRSLQRTTLFEYVNNWKLFVRGCGHDAEALISVIGDFSEFENIKSMSASRRNWCEAFHLDAYKQAAFFSLPGNLYREAKKAMWEYERGSHHEKDAAIAIGIAACAAAIWTSLPLRISTLLNLTYGDENADVQLHGKRRGLVLTTPPDIVKNGYSHRYITLTPKRGGDPQEIVSWFVREVRPYLLEAHIARHLRKPDQLFCGVSYGRLASIWKSVSLDAGVPMTPHQVRHALATIMANQPNADFSIIAALLGDTEMTVRKNYAFVDQARKHVEGQALLAQLQGHILMRGIS